MKFDIYDPDGTSPALRFVLGLKGNAPLYVIGVNPSTACREKSDPTINKVRELSRHWGYDGFVMLNLYPVRRSRPSELPRVHKSQRLQANAKFIHSLLCAKSPVSIWAAWGNAVDLRQYLLKSLCEIDKAVASANIKWLACGELTKPGGKTKGGNPRHPNPREPLSQTMQRRLVDFDFRTYLRRKLPD